MIEDRSWTGAARDVPPPRPVDDCDAAVPVDSGPARAARAIADAVAGLLGSTAPDSVSGGRPTATVRGLRDVVGAVTAAVGAALGGAATTRQPPGPGAAPRGARTPAALLEELLSAAAPRLPIRDADRLRRAHPGAADHQIAEALVKRTARLTASIGAATGGLSAAHWFAAPSLLALPLEMGAETVLVAGIEVVLVGELHELYGRAAPGDERARAAAYLTGWSSQRAVVGLSVPGVGASGLGGLLGNAAMRSVRRRLSRRLARSIPVAAPFLLGAALAARGNRRATEDLATRLLADLRGLPASEPGPAER